MASILGADHPMYDTPTGKVGMRFISMLASEFNGVRARKWNSERPIIFAPIILRKTTGVYKARNIRTWITRRLNDWEKGNYAALVADTIGEALCNVKSKTTPPEENEIRARVFNSLLLSGRVREAVRYSTTETTWESWTLKT